MTKTEEDYLKSINALSGNTCSKNNAAEFLQCKSTLLAETIINAPSGEGKTIVDHYAKKLSRVAELIVNDELTERGDTDFALDQINSAKRVLLKERKDTSGLDNFLSNLSKIIESLSYSPKGEV